MTRAGMLTLALCIAALPGAGAFAQSYPSRNLRYLITGSPGSGADTLGRLVADGLAREFGRQVVAENRPGGGSNIAAEMAAKSPPDGYLLFQMTITHAVNATLYPRLQYDLFRDFEPVTQIATGPAVLVVHPSLPVRSVGELVRLARSRPGALNYASGGTGTFTFLAAELFKGQTGTDLLHVPYRGGGGALNAVISGEVSVYFAPVGVALPNIQERRLRALAVSTQQRVPLLPDLPTLSQAGVPGYESGNWYGLLVPARTPPEVVATIRSAAAAAIGEALTRRRLVDLGFVPIADTPEAFRAHIKAEVDRLGRIVRAFKLTPE